MPQSWEQYIRSQEIPEECPVCQGQYMDEDGTSRVPDSLIPFCSEPCRDVYLAAQAADAESMALAIIEDAKLAAEWKRSSGRR